MSTAKKNNYMVCGASFYSDSSSNDDSFFSMFVGTFKRFCK